MKKRFWDIGMNEDGSFHINEFVMDGNELRRNTIFHNLKYEDTAQELVDALTLAEVEETREETEEKK